MTVADPHYASKPWPVVGEWAGAEGFTVKHYIRILLQLAVSDVLVLARVHMDLYLISVGDVSGRIIWDGSLWKLECM